MTSSKFNPLCRVLITNLDNRTTDEQLEEYASKYGTVIDCHVNNENDDSFIDFSKPLHVDSFMDKRPHILDGLELNCRRCLPMNELQKQVKRIFVRGSRAQISEHRLNNYFIKYGKVLSSNIPHGKQFGFLAFSDYDIVDKIIQDKPHKIGGVELEVKKAEDLQKDINAQSRISNLKNNRPKSLMDIDMDSRCVSPSLNRQTSTISNSVRTKRMRSESYNSQTEPSRLVEKLKDIENENRKLKENELLIIHRFENDLWRAQTDLDDERRRHDQLKLEYEFVRRELNRKTLELDFLTGTRLNGHTQHLPTRSRY
ncbi:unnamed protein product [Didymodactylos carnosus]|uniref:RRM domain-containing protein n=1 Tax=Didymodactylos carnosus TaxID=1234261 RepID=A0A813XF81_9BILA|nr:unnamed protein product [Didymodactylos carnosus]CAF1013297.1 unnamed protein product [Didymodactylos carnosus]CAF3659570.1 unnamed protein product [Didymodactylos carnosus]CAF3782236.1 unnamed protein product [Didymodactylos carnosus]